MAQSLHIKLNLEKVPTWPLKISKYFLDIKFRILNLHMETFTMILWIFEFICYKASKYIKVKLQVFFF